MSTENDPRSALERSLNIAGYGRMLPGRFLTITGVETILLTRNGDFYLGSRKIPDDVLSEIQASFQVGLNSEFISVRNVQGEGIAVIEEEHIAPQSRKNGMRGFYLTKDLKKMRAFVSNGPMIALGGAY